MNTINLFPLGNLDSKETKTLNVVNLISNALNEGEYCIGIFLDLRKAFDVCDHEILFKKLKNKGVTGKP